jgi:antitoxin component of MazEF toxin-antitoxin module
MTRTLQKHGNSFALVFDKPLLDSLSMTPDVPLQVIVSGGSVIITPVHTGIPQEELKATIKRLRPRYKTMLENLAK